MKIILKCIFGFMLRTCIGAERIFYYFFFNFRNYLIFILLFLGTGRSVPSTPSQVSPQGEQISGESNAEVAPSVEEQMSESSQSQGRGKPLVPIFFVMLKIMIVYYFNRRYRKR